jgi:hypothetical protein
MGPGLDLAAPVDLHETKATWLAALDEAESFVRGRDPMEAGCLYWSPSRQVFFCPGLAGADDAVPHFGRPGGVLPRISE